MKIQDLVQTCLDAIAAGRKTISLVLPGDSSGNTRCLCGRSGPRGEVVSAGDDGSIVAFDAKKVLKFLQTAVVKHSSSQ